MDETSKAYLVYLVKTLLVALFIGTTFYWSVAIITLFQNGYIDMPEIVNTRSKGMLGDDILALSLIYLVTHVYKDKKGCFPFGKILFCVVFFFAIMFTQNPFTTQVEELKTTLSILIYLFIITCSISFIICSSVLALYRDYKTEAEYYVSPDIGIPLTILLAFITLMLPQVFVTN